MKKKIYMGLHGRPLAFDMCSLVSMLVDWEKVQSWAEVHSSQFCLVLREAGGGSRGPDWVLVLP